MIGHKVHNGSNPRSKMEVGKIEAPIPERNPELGGSKVGTCALRQPQHQTNNPSWRGDSSVAHTLRPPLPGMCASFEVLDLDCSTGWILETVSAKIFQTFDGNVRAQCKEYEKGNEIARCWKYVRMHSFQSSQCLIPSATLYCVCLN